LVLHFYTCKDSGKLCMQSVPITTKVVSSNPTHSKVYLIHYYMIKFVSDLQQVSHFLRVLQFPPPIMAPLKNSKYWMLNKAHLHYNDIIWNKNHLSHIFYNYWFMQHIQSNLPMRSPLLKGHLFLILSQKCLYELNLF
jgi:hypothetical protein